MAVSRDLHLNAAAAVPARLLIHAGPDKTSAAAGAGARALLWLQRRWTRLRSGRSPAVACVVQIEDLLGRRCFDALQVCPLLEVMLPAGTYHVSVGLGGLHLRYTVALEQGGTAHLHLRSALKLP
jgi:hypothetical protein